MGDSERPIFCLKRRVSQFVKYDGTSFPHDGTQLVKKEQSVASMYEIFTRRPHFPSKWICMNKALFHFLSALFWQFKVDLQAQRTRWPFQIKVCTKPHSSWLTANICFIFNFVSIFESPPFWKYCSGPECDEYIRIFEFWNIFYTNIYSDIRSYQFSWYEYIRIFVRIIFLIRIYLDIRSYQNHTLLECDEYQKSKGLMRASNQKLGPGGASRIYICLTHKKSCIFVTQTNNICLWHK